MLIYLDSSVLLAWIKGENTSAGPRSIILEMMHEAEPGKKFPKYRFVVSPIVVAEIWSREEYKPKYDKFLVMMKKSFISIALDMHIAHEVARVRCTFSTRHNAAFPRYDAIHVATAISHAQYLCSLDKDMLRRKKEIEDLAGGKMKVITPQEVPGISRLLGE